MKTNLFIPDNIRIGFQKRENTFTNKLAYVIYYDEKGKIRKEPSWKSWCDEKLGSLEIENKPHNGFLFNKGIKRDGYHWGSGRSVIRVYDPRDFEFEINVDNLIGILMHSDVSKRDIVEQCVYAWSGQDLVLLPINSQQYKDSVEYTKKQSLKVSARDLVKGRQYQRKKSDEIVTYIGYYQWHDMHNDYDNSDISTTYQKAKGKKHIFCVNGSIEPCSVTTLSNEVSADIVPNYADLVDNFINSYKSQFIKDFNITQQITTQRCNSEWESLSLYKEGMDNDNKMCVYKLYFGFSHKNATFDKVTFNCYKSYIGLDSNGNVNFSSMQYNYRYAYHSRRNEVSDTNMICDTIKRQLATLIAKKRINIKTHIFHVTEIYKLVNECGWGEGCATLEDGTTIPYKL